MFSLKTRRWFVCLSIAYRVTKTFWRSFFDGYHQNHFSCLKEVKKTSLNLYYYLFALWMCDIIPGEKQSLLFLNFIKHFSHVHIQGGLANSAYFVLKNKNNQIRLCLGTRKRVKCINSHFHQRHFVLINEIF